MLIGIPIRSFSTAKQRLASHLTQAQRHDIAERMATHVLALAASFAPVVIATTDEEVSQWAASHGVETVEDGGTLNGAAAAVVGRAGPASWGVLHADLPLITTADLEQAIAGLGTHGAAIAPSWDGGTSLILANGPFRFSYGPGSFHRHIGQRRDAAVIVRPGLALDIDEPEHLNWLSDGRLGS